MDSTILAKIEELTRLGKLREAKLCILGLKSKKIDRALRQPLSALARRLNIPSLALIFLRPVVKPSERSISNATHLENLEYAVALSELGATTEAHKVFKQVSAKDLPRVLLYQSFAYFKTWDYKDSLPLLRQYILTESLTDYQRSVGLANLVAAAVYEETEDSRLLAERFVLESRQKGYSRNLAYGLQLLAQVEIKNKRWEQAEKCLKEAESMILDPESLDKLFIKKWQAVLILSKGQTKTGLKLLYEVRTEALKLKHWETVRNCDFHEARLTLNKDLLLLNYFGTPFPSLKERLTKTPSLQLIPPNYIWFPKSKGTKVWSWLDEETTSGLKTGTATYRLATVLSSDFYRPLPIAELHALVYPSQYFNPHTSPNRVHKLVERLRQILDTRKLAIKIIETEGTYQLDIPDGQGIAIFSEKSTTRSEALSAKALDFMTSQKTFIRQDLCIKLKISRSAAQRLLQEALNNQIIEKVGSTKSVFYRLKKEIKLAA